MSVVDDDGKLLGMITMRDLYAPLEHHDAQAAVEEPETRDDPGKSVDNSAW
jgi:CBS domain-containing protein